MLWYKICEREKERDGVGGGEREGGREGGRGRGRERENEREGERRQSVRKREREDSAPMLKVKSPRKEKETSLTHIVLQPLVCACV